jgi:nucleoside-diphosphate-sugar epimerase
VSRVLLTGATGVVGRHAASALERRGYEVHSVARSASAGDRGRGHSEDLLDPEAAERLVAAVAPTHLLHLAWYTEPGRYLESPENGRWLEASERLLRAFAASGGRRAVVTGTCGEYDWSRAQTPLSEHRSPLAPQGAYGVAKDSLRRRLERLSAESGLSGAWARLFFLFGPAQDTRLLVPSVATSLLAGRPAPSTEGRQVRDYLLSSEAADALAALLDSEVTGPVNVASGQGVAVRDLVELVGASTGRPDLLRVGALPGRPEDVPYLVADTARLEQEVGWRPRGALAAWVDETVAWWREHGSG